MEDFKQTIRIFISSPGDVVEERDGARRVIAGLQRLYPSADLQPVLWEELALPVTASFQETIDFLLQREPIDIAVFILWSRLGSPLGTAIARPDGSPYRSGTEREFDLMLAAFEQSGRKRPVILAYARDDDAAFKQRLTEIPTTELEEFVNQRKLADSFIREQFHDSEGRNLRAFRTYSEPIGFLDQLKGHLRGTLDELLEADKAITWTEEPYRGLETFDVQHAPIFFGRHEETCELLHRLRDQERAGRAFVVIVGASGSGKSSLARAGVAANLNQPSSDSEGVKWKVSSFIPALTQQGLCHELVRSLAEALPDLCDFDAGLDRIAKGLAQNASLTVELTIAPAFERARPPIRLLLILDQMEELWTDRHITEEDREGFLAACEALAGSGHVSILGTLRSDFYHHAQASPAFRKLKGKHSHFDLGPPDATAIHRLITEPARLAGLKFERNEQTGRSLDEMIWEDASHHSDALPLLEYTLSELYGQRDENRGLLTYAAYVELGGVEGAIGKRADETFTSLPKEAQAALDEILPLLITVDVAGEQSAVRRRASVADLTSTPARKTLVDRLIAARFLTTDRQDDKSVASLAHEALLRRWDRIVDWIRANREQLGLRARVEQMQQRWEQQERDDSLLLAEGLPLDEGRQLLSEAPYLLSVSTKDFIETSIAFHEHKAKRGRRVKAVVLSTIAALLVALIVGGIGMRQINAKETRRVEAKGLVQQLLKAETSDVPRVLEAITDYRDLTREDLARAYESSEQNSKEKLHAALALLADDESVLPFVKDRLLSAAPAQVGTICSLLADHRDQIVAELWPILESPSPDQDVQVLQVATALAMHDSGNQEKWNAVSPRVAEKLVKENALRLAVWINTLRPVSSYLVSPLSDIYRSAPGDRSQSEIDLATELLEQYAAGDLDALSELLLDAQPEQFTALFDEFSAHGEKAISKLDQELDRVLTPHWDDLPLDKSWKKPSAEVVDRLKKADGMIAERFAVCQALPLEDFTELAEELKQSGYRPIRLRPYAHQGSVNIAAAWARDGREWRSETALSVESVLETDEAQRNDGFAAIDVAGYVGTEDGEPAEQYAALWVKRQSDGDDARIYAGIPFVGHKTAYGKLEESGFKFQHSLQSFRDLAGQQKYCGVKSKAGGSGSWSWGLTATQYDDQGFLDKIRWDIDPSAAADPETTKERNEKALADAETKLKVNAEDLNARFARAQSYFYLGQDENSLKDMGHVIQFAPEIATSYRFRSILYARLGDAAAARADLQSFSERSSSEAAMKAYLDVVVSSYLGEESEAMNRLDTVIKEGHDNNGTLYDAACAYSIASGVYQSDDATKSQLYADRAVALLRLAIEVGYSNYSHIQEDADLDPIRDHDGFVELMKAGNLDLRYAAVWNESTQFESRESHGLSPAEHLEACRVMQQDGYRLVSVGAASIDGKIATASVWHRPLIPAREREKLAGRQANAAAAMARLGEHEKLFPALRVTDDPESLTQFVHRCRDEGVTPRELLECLKLADRSRQALGSDARRIEDRVLFGLLLALGEFTLDELPSDQKQSTVEQVSGWYRDDPSSAIHGATGWLLRRWGQTDLVQQVDQTAMPYDPEREWFTLAIAADRQTFYQTYVVVPPGEYTIGSPSDETVRESIESVNRVRLTRPVAILDREITRGEFEASGVVSLNVAQYSPTLEHPMVAPSWYDSVQFCRWLTKTAGFSEADQAYANPSELPPSQYARDAETGLPKNWPLNLDARGFRLPTEAEWEIAARAGMRTMYSFGGDKTLLDRYGWYQVNSGRQTHVAKELRPNLRGLFDMHGNLYEWCHDWYDGYPLGSMRNDPVGSSSGSNRVFRGGGWNFVAAYCRSAYRLMNQPSFRYYDFGLRVALVPFVPVKQVAEPESVGTEGASGAATVDAERSAEPSGEQTSLE